MAQSLRERLTAIQLAEVLSGLIDYGRAGYLGSWSEAQKRFFATTVGAGIYYLPTSESELWTGFISKSLLQLYADTNVAKPRRVKDHIVPRKSAGDMLIRSPDWPDGEHRVAFMLEQYVTKLGRYHLITSDKNYRLKSISAKHADMDWNTAYAKASIALASITLAELRLVRKRHPETIACCIDRCAIPAPNG